MKHKLINKESYNLHMIKTDKFKTLFFRIVLSEKIKKEDITKRNLLIDNLMFSNKKYKTLKDLNIKKQDLYGANIGMTNRRVGDHIYTEYFLSILDPNYTEKSMLEESIKFYKDILFNPNVVDNHFEDEKFKLCKKNMASDIMMISERPSSYGFQRFMEEMDDKAEFSYNLDGNINDLNEITSTSLYEYYKKFMNNNIDIFVVGNFDFNEIEQIISKYFKFQGKTTKEEVKVHLNNKRKDIKKTIEDSKFSQTKFYAGAKINNLTLHQKKYEMVIYNIILGNSPESKFFKSVREKNSLAYSINSLFRRLDDIFYITSGISFNNHEEVLKIIEKNMEEMKQKDFSDADLDKAKTLFISMLKDIYEGASSIADHYFNVYYFKSDSIKKQINQINKITKEDIVNVAKKINIDTVYVLKEGQHEEN